MDNNMKSAFFIMQLWQTGNIRSHNIKKLGSNPKKGYQSYEEAKTGMLELLRNGDWELNESGYAFAIMELFYKNKING